MNIGLLAVDSRYPNLALMKISSYQQGTGRSCGVVQSAQPIR